jgi:hypothetical protein
MTNSTPPPARPRYAYWLMLVVALLALMQIVFVIRVLQLPGELASQVNLRIPLEFVAGILWAGVFGFCTLTLVRNRLYALRYTGWALLGFLVYSVARLFIFAQADYDRQRLSFLLVLTIVILVMVLMRAVWIGIQARESLNNDSESQN